MHRSVGQRRLRNRSEVEGFRRDGGGHGDVGVEVDPPCRPEVPQGRVESRRVEPTIVVDPSANVRIEHPRQIVERLVAALVKRPASDRLSDRPERFGPRTEAKFAARQVKVDDKAGGIGSLRRRDPREHSAVLGQAATDIADALAAAARGRLQLSGGEAFGRRLLACPRAVEHAPQWGLKERGDRRQQRLQTAWQERKRVDQRLVGLLVLSILCRASVSQRKEQLYDNIQRIG